MEPFSRRSPLSPGPRRATIGVAELTSLVGRRRGSDSSDEWDGMGVGETSAPDTPVDRRSWAGHPKDVEGGEVGGEEDREGRDSSFQSEDDFDKGGDDVSGEEGGWEGEAETSVEVEHLFEKMGLTQTWKETTSPAKPKSKLTPIRPFSSTSSRNTLFGSPSPTSSPSPHLPNTGEISHPSPLASGSFGEISFSSEDAGGVPKSYDQSISPSSSRSSLSSMRIISGSSEEGHIGTSLMGFGSGEEEEDESTPDSSLETPSPFSLSPPHPKTQQSVEEHPTQLQVPAFESPSTPFKISTFPILSPLSPIHIPRSSIDRAHHIDYFETATTSPLRIAPKSTLHQLLPPFQERSTPVESESEPFSPQSDTYSDEIPGNANLKSRFSLSTDGSIQSDEQLLEMEEGRQDIYGGIEEESDDDNPFLYRPPSLPSLQLTPDSAFSRTPIPSPHPTASNDNSTFNPHLLSHPPPPPPPHPHSHSIQLHSNKESELIPPISKFQRHHSPTSDTSLKLAPPLTFKPSHYQAPPAPLFITDNIISSSSPSSLDNPEDGSSSDPFGSEGVTPTQQSCSGVSGMGKGLEEYVFPDFSQDSESLGEKKKGEEVWSPQSTSSFDPSIFRLDDESGKGRDDIQLRKMGFVNSHLLELNQGEGGAGGKFENVNFGPRTPTQRIRDRDNGRSFESGEGKGKGKVKSRLSVLRESWEELSTPSPGDGPGRTPFNTPAGLVEDEELGGRKGNLGGEGNDEEEQEEVAELRSVSFSRPQTRPRPMGRIFDQVNNSTKDIDNIASPTLSSSIFGPTFAAFDAAQSNPRSTQTPTSTITLTKRKSSKDKEEAHRLAKKVRDLEEKCRRLERKNQKVLLEAKRGGGTTGGGGKEQSMVEKGLDEVMADMGINLDSQTIICLSPVVTSLSTCPACQKSLFSKDDSEWEGETERADRWRTEHWSCLPLVGEILALARTGVPGSP